MSDATQALNYLYGREDTILRALEIRLSRGQYVDLSDTSRFAAEVFNIGIGCQWRQPDRHIDIRRVRDAMHALKMERVVLIVRREMKPARAWYVTVEFYDALEKLRAEYAPARPLAVLSA